MMMMMMMITTTTTTTIKLEKHKALQTKELDNHILYTPLSNFVSSFCEMCRLLTSLFATRQTQCIWRLLPFCRLYLQCQAVKMILKKRSLYPFQTSGTTYTKNQRHMKHYLNLQQHPFENSRFASFYTACLWKYLSFNLWTPYVLYIGQVFRYSPENAFYTLINKYISLSDICLTVHHWYK